MMEKSRWTRDQPSDHGHNRTGGKKSLTFRRRGIILACAVLCAGVFLTLTVQAGTIAGDREVSLHDEPLLKTPDLPGNRQHMINPVHPGAAGEPISRDRPAVSDAVFEGTDQKRPVSIAWQRCLGGSDDDRAKSIRQTTDGGYILVGETGSTDGDVIGHHGGTDVWVVKLDATGAIEWERCLGGSDQDTASSIQQTDDTGYIIAATTRSTDGDVIGHHGGTSPGGITERDGWVIKLNTTGAIEWQRCLGGTGDDRAEYVQQTAEGGYIIAGYAASSDGDLTGLSSDTCWVLKIGPEGGIEWQNLFGAFMFNTCVQQTKDGEYVICGWTALGTHGMFDGYVLNLTAAGAARWQRDIGGIRRDYAYSIRQTGDGGYILAGSTTSEDLEGYHGDPELDSLPDGMAVKLSATGAVDWLRCLGGSGDDRCSSVELTDEGGYILAGSTASNDGDASGNHGGYDIWMVKMDAGGGIEWQRCLGGSADERAGSAEQTADGGYIIAGSTASNDGDVSGNHGGHDIWVVKLESNGPVSGPLAFPGQGDPPTDPDGDGLYEDVDGNGLIEFNDVIVYYENMPFIREHQPLAAFDYDGSGMIGYNDVVTLYQML
ncbi:hypothetical protein [Methanofollis tationis]|nr:hypothetical protein [Methanofollis tationis]